MKIRTVSIFEKSLIGAASLSIFLIILPSVLLADQITWMVRDWIPYQYEEGGELKGYGIEMQRMIEQELSQYQHKYLIANPARTIAEFKEKRTVCSLGVFKNPNREEFMHFGIPNELFFHIRLYMRKASFEKMGRPKKVSLQSVLESKEGILAITKGRSYEEAIDKILKRYEGAKNIIVRSDSVQSLSAIQMMATERIDFFLEFVVEGNLATKRLGVEEKIVSVALEEVPETGLGYVACAKTSWGEKAIRAINKALLKLRPTKKYRQSYEKYLRKEQIPTFRKAYNKKLLKIIE